MLIDGQCHCGHVRYEAEIEPEQVGVCHCTDCQVLTGSAFRVTVTAPRDRIRLTAHQPKVYVKIGDGGRRRLQSFCPECGSPLFVTGEGADAEEWGIRWGSIRQREQLVPKRQSWCGSAVPWIYRIADLPGRQGD
ncbi:MULTISPECIES: GFA family protein [Inquilinus]|uniref:CENP-V/GFA domain-containing protein n=1 Tax=Inquilinus ginsengisoli TaxID=363840 RepID=A0ABU1JN10_9PROT|nr:GFA family protein [Inquilinus ginsengisoli]MDR6289703.1 hypothetical protein [Inquilinus ginsengisoli]